MDAALQMPPGQRLAWVDALGPEHEAIRSRLRALVARSCQAEVAHESLSTLPKLSDTAMRSEPAQSPSPQLAGAKVGPYVLLRRLGIGGMAVVWLAKDTLPGRERLVALKFAHSIPNRGDLLTRLARERDMLASLEHPNIARLYDAGVTTHQRPYLVLEYVEGVPLDEHCDRQCLGLARRLALFVQVADAVTHAHERRIVHRDLKPSNVLVTPGGEARLLDFGVGKILGDDATGGDFQLSHLTGRPLTPAYASPEQITGAEIGFATDIYSLGVMLYELLTGARPYKCPPDSARAMRAAILDIVPLAPSEAAADPAAKARLRGGLDSMILTALRKQPERRQASMREFASQLEHHARLLAR